MKHSTASPKRTFQHSWNRTDESGQPGFDRPGSEERRIVRQRRKIPHSQARESAECIEVVHQVVVPLLPAARASTTKNSQPTTSRLAFSLCTLESCTCDVLPSCACCLITTLDSRRKHCFFGGRLGETLRLLRILRVPVLGRASRC